MAYVTILVLLISVSISTGEISMTFSEAIQQDIYNIYNKISFRSTSQNTTISKDKINFYLFSNRSANDTLIDSSNASALHSKGPLIFLIHGWLGDRKGEWYQEYTDLFLKWNSQSNVVQVDYSTYSKIGYLAACSISKEVGYTIGEFIINLIQEHSISENQILIIGHSLGGQIGGFVGKKVQEILNKKLPRFIGLDPAGPIFSDQEESNRLNKDDFQVVEVFHTNGNYFGMESECGTIDFYLNGGSLQPGCVRESIISFVEVSVKVLCSHARSWEVFPFAFQNPGQFIGRKLVGDSRNCDKKNSCQNKFVDMGDITTNETGNYYVNTTSSPPFYNEAQKVE